MIDLYYNLGPNPAKVALFLEESALPYRIIPVDTSRGEQFSPEVAALNPNNKLPIIVDDGVTVFDSNAILLYLAEKYGKFLPEAADRGALLSWLMFVASGLGPYCGQAVHFRRYAPGPEEYSVQRYDYEARRHYRVLDDHLAQRRWIVGEVYTIVDMAVWGWARNIDIILGADARPDFPNLMRFVDMIEARPAAQASVALREKYDFKREIDAETRRNMFRHTAPAA